MASCLPFFDFLTKLVHGARTSSLPPTPNLDDQVPVFVSPSDSLAHVYIQAPGSLFVAFYDSQGYDGGILSHLHVGKYFLIFVIIYTFIYDISINFPDA
jgi:hypothetical protein